MNKMVKMVSGEMIVGEFIDDINTPMIVYIKNPMVVGLYAHPQDQSKIMIDMAPWNPFASKGEGLNVNVNKFMYEFPENEKVQKIINQYVSTITNIVIPEIQK